MHEVRLWTSFDKKIGWAEPHAEVFWQVPIAVTSSSPFQDLGYGSTHALPGEQAGVSFGFEAAAVDDKATQNHVSLDLGSRIVAHFEGRDYSEMWEVFKLAGNASSTCRTRWALDADPTTAGGAGAVQSRRHEHREYLQVAANAALRVQIGKRVRLAFLGEVVVNTDHAITFDDAGIPSPSCAPGQTTNCENGNPVVHPNTREVNPAYVPAIDLVGHRYLSEHDLGVVLGLQAQFLF